MDLCNSKDEAGLESYGVGVMYSVNTNGLFLILLGILHGNM